MFFLKTGTTLAFFPFWGELPFSKYDRKIMPSGLQIFKIRILIISWPWAFSGLIFLIIFKISYVENSTDESDLHVFLVRTEGSLLLLLTREHCLEKKSLKSSAFSLKSMMKLPLCNRGGMLGIFLLFRKVFNIDQYDFGLVLLYNSLSERRE